CWSPSRGVKESPSRQETQRDFGKSRRGTSRDSTSPIPPQREPRAVVLGCRLLSQCRHRGERLGLDDVLGSVGAWRSDCERLLCPTERRGGTTDSGDSEA